MEAALGRTIVSVIIVVGIVIGCVYLIRNILTRKEIKEHVGTMDKGIALLLFAILLQMCSTGMELLTLLIGVIGLYLVISDTKK